MRLTFVAIGCEQLAISQLSAIAREEGHTVNLAFSASVFNDRFNLSIPSLAPFFDDRDNVIEAIKKQNPDVIAFSVLTGTYQWMLGIAKEAKEIYPNVKIIFGGVHVSAVPERVLAQPQVDYVVVGEGDVAFPSILRAIENGGPAEPILNTRFKLGNGEVVKGPQTGFIQDLDSLPFYDKILWEDHIRVGDLYLTMASRGCPYRCTFCFNNFFAKLPEGKKGKYVRQRSVDHMIYELKQAKKRYKIKCVDFEDDIFTVDKKWIKEFTDRYKKEIDVPYQCLVHPKYIDDDVSRWLYESGCRYVQMGVQTMDDDFKYNVIKRYEKTDNVQIALDVMRKHKLRVKTDHMFALPGEPEGAQEAARKLFVEHPPHRIQTFWTNFLPGTEMVHQALEMGLIDGEDVERLNDGLQFDFFRTNNNVKNNEETKEFKAYELIFKLIPFVPLKLRRRLSPRAFKKLPVPVSSFLAFIVDAVTGLLFRNPTHTSYAMHNLFQMYAFLRKRIGLKPVKASRILTQDKYLFEVPAVIANKNKIPNSPQTVVETASS